MMGAFSPIHIIVVVLIILVLFGGRGKIASIMGDAAKGIRAFKDGLKDGEAKDSAALPRQDADKDDARADR